MNLERKDWIRALSAHAAPVLNALADQLAEGCTVVHTTLPQAGLGLLQLSDGAFHEPYYLGEFPLSSCRIEITLADGRRAEGAAQILADDAKLARSLAILDAILAARIPGWEQVSKCVESGTLQNSEKDHCRRVMLTATRVDFDLLGTTEENINED
ncbi:MAG: phosphonate C-P lyase system protein PhnG [Pseudomonadota bacterium]